MVEKRVVSKNNSRLPLMEGEVPGTYSLLAAGEPAQQVSDEWQLAGSAALKINFR